VRSLYGLRTSGASWHGYFADVMHLLYFSPFKAFPDVWMHHCITHYKYVPVYLDDIGKEPQQVINSLINKHGFKLKGVTTTQNHLVGDFFRDSDGTLTLGAHSYISKMFNNYDTMYIPKPKEFTTPMIEKDHLEVATTALLVALGIKQYQSLYGALQCLVT
jgi:hypothetical protein